MSSVVACIGGCHVDRTALIEGDAVPGSSNPVTITRHAGGVATNVARTAARLGADVRLAALVGGDADGDHLVSVLSDDGVGVSSISRHPSQPTAEYTAIIDGQGSLVMGIAAMDLYEAMDAAWVESILPKIEDAEVWVLDANVAPSGIAALVARRADRLLVADPVSVAKAARLKSHLAEFDAVFPDGQELQVLAEGDGGPAVLAGDLAGSGPMVVASLGSRGVIVADHASVRELQAVPPQRVVDPTGAGDALLGGWVAGRVLGQDAERWALAAASLAVEVRGPVPSGLDRAALEARL